MALCERCGSIQIARVASKPTDRVVKLFTGRKPFLCRRCGWKARRAWKDDVRVDRGHMALDAAAAYDPDMAVLDGARPTPKEPVPHHPSAGDRAKSGARRPRRRRSRRARRRNTIGVVAITAGAIFVVVMLGLAGSCGGGDPDAGDTVAMRRTTPLVPYLRQATPDP